MNARMIKRWTLTSACVTVAAVAWLHVYRTSPNTRWDFPEFYIAANVPLAELYNQQSFEAAGRSLLAGEGVSYYPPYVRLAVYAIPLKVLAGLPYGTAYLIWTAFQLILLFSSGFLISRIFPGLAKIWFLPFLAFFPAFFGIIFGQDSAVVLFLLCASLYCLIRGCGTLGGVMLGAAFYKFNLILLLPVYLILTRQWRALTGFAAIAGLAVALSAFLAPMAGYLDLLAHISKFTTGFSPENMIGMRGLAAAVGMPWLYVAGLVVITPLTLVAAAKSDLIDGFAIALAGSMLCAYHVNGYDGILASIPLVALMARVEDSPLRVLMAAAVVWMSRPPLWLSPLILLTVLGGLVAPKIREWRLRAE